MHRLATRCTVLTATLLLAAACTTNPYTGERQISNENGKAAGARVSRYSPVVDLHPVKSFAQVGREGIHEGPEGFGRQLLGPYLDQKVSGLGHGYEVPVPASLTLSSIGKPRASRLA